MGKSIHHLRKILVLLIICAFISLNAVSFVDDTTLANSISNEDQNGKHNRGNDTVSPFTNISLNGTMGKDGWYASDVMVTLYATDNDSGVNVTYYRKDYNQDWQIYTGQFPVQRYSIIFFYSVDNEGNREVPKVASIKIDQILPHGILVTTLIRCDVILRVVCEDNLSGVDRIEFYVNGTLMFSDNESPFEWTRHHWGLYDTYDAYIYDMAGNRGYPPHFLGSEYVIGLIRDRKFTEDYMTCYAIALWSSSDGLHVSEPLTFPKTLFGYVGRFFICASLSMS